MRMFYRKSIGVFFVGVTISLLSGIFRYHHYCSWFDLGIPCGDVRGWPFAYYETAGAGYFDLLTFVFNAVFYTFIFAAILVIKKLLGIRK